VAVPGDGLAWQKRFLWSGLVMRGWRRGDVAIGSSNGRAKWRGEARRDNSTRDNSTRGYCEVASRAV